jgi:hypothetical protein
VVSASDVSFVTIRYQNQGLCVFSQSHSHSAHSAARAPGGVLAVALYMLSNPEMLF